VFAGILRKAIKSCKNNDLDGWGDRIRTWKWRNQNRMLDLASSIAWLRIMSLDVTNHGGGSGWDRLIRHSYIFVLGRFGMTLIYSGAAQDDQQSKNRAK
jgi:hypothetical protein